jgi:hypothetical protein
MNASKHDSKRLSPLKAIRVFCVWCCGGSAHEVNLCPAGPEAKHPCVFWAYRMGIIPPGASRSLMRAIKARCLDCLPDGATNCDASQAYEIHPPCPLWVFRMGRNPNYGAEQREKLRAHGKRAGFRPGSQPESGCRIIPKPVDGGTCGREIQTCLNE